MATVFDAPPVAAPDLPGQPVEGDTGPKPGSFYGAGDSYQPHPYLPTRGHLTYLKELLTVTLLVLALPVFFLTLVRNPRAFAGTAAAVS